MIRWRLASPAGIATPVAVFELVGEPDKLDTLLEQIARPCGVGSHRLARVLDLDEALVVRPEPGTAWLMPHGGPAIVRRIAGELADRLGEPRSTEPETIDHRAGEALARARSPLAIDLLLAQPALWRAPGATSDPERDRRLRALIEPPVVAMLGPPNVGKSTLLNTLAGRSASVVADEPGTTRDHVGVEIDFAGLVCRVLDLPGIRDSSDPVEREAVRLAIASARGAELVLLAGDALSPPPEALLGLVGACSSRRVALRSDLGEPDWPADASLSCQSGSGLEGLVRLVRETLIPPADLESDVPWRFWEAPPPRR